MGKTRHNKYDDYEDDDHFFELERRRSARIMKAYMREGTGLDIVDDDDRRKIRRHR